MLESLTDIDLFPHRKPRKREALKPAFKLRWNENSIRALAKRLEGCRSQMILAIFAAFRYSHPRLLSLFFYLSFFLSFFLLLFSSFLIKKTLIDCYISEHASASHDRQEILTRQISHCNEDLEHLI